MKKFKDFLLEKQLSYDDWIKASIAINTEVDNFSKSLITLAKSAPNGIVSDKIRNTNEYKKVDSNYKNAFKRLQIFNKTKVPKSYRTQKRKDFRSGLTDVYGNKI